MMRDDPAPPAPSPPGDSRTVVVAVVTAACTTLVTALASWAVEELRARYGTKKPSATPPPAS